MSILGALSIHANHQGANQLSTRFTIAYLKAFLLMLLIESRKWIWDKPFEVKGRRRCVQVIYR